MYFELPPTDCFARRQWQLFWDQFHFLRERLHGKRTMVIKTDLCSYTEHLGRIFEGRSGRLGPGRSHFLFVLIWKNHEDADAWILWWCTMSYADTSYIMWYLWWVINIYLSCVRCCRFASKLDVLDMVSERSLQVQDLSWPRSEVCGKGCQGEAQCIIACYCQLSYRADLQSNEETQETMNLKISGELLHQCQGWLLVPPANQACASFASLDVWGNAKLC